MKAMHILQAAIAILVVCLQAAYGEDNPTFEVVNDIDRSIDFYIASEKNQSENPWKHLTLKRFQTAKIALDDPDRYFIVLETDTGYARSKPLELKQFIAKHSNYKMWISEARSHGLGLESSLAATITPSDSKNGANDNTQTIRFEETGGPAVWKLSDR